MDTAEISYRVADFLKQYPPFTAIDDADLLRLAARGRVRFHEPSEYLLWQGEPHRQHVFVIQQGTVSLWEDAGGRSTLRDVRGSGDMLGIERYHGAARCEHSARSESEVLIYAFPADDFSQFILKYPHAEQFVAAEGRLTADYQGAAVRRDPHRTFLHAIADHQPLSTCRATDTLAHLARRMLTARSHTVAVVDERDRIRGVVTAHSLVGWVAAGGGDAETRRVETLLADAPIVLSPNASVADGVLAMSASETSAIALTTDGTDSGQVQAIITPTDFAPIFGDQPADLLREIRRANSSGELRDLNQRARAFTLEYLTAADTVEWLGTLTRAIDTAIIGRVLALNGVVNPRECWCFAGSSGRDETLTMLAPHVVVIADESADLIAAAATHRLVLDVLAECGYLPRERTFEPSFYAATDAEWKARYRGWLRDPVMQQTHRARTLFDLRPVCGPRSLWQDVEAAVAAAVDRDVLHVLANDCLTMLPPLTFYQDAVVDHVGEHDSVFRLEERALRPMVDVGRVFGMAGGAIFARSTLDRFATARALLPAHERIFREAADAFRVVLWQQGRVGLVQRTTGAELPPALLSRNDRHVLKRGFRSILELLEFTADRTWLENL